MNIWQVRVDGYPHTQAFDMVALCLRESIRDLGFESHIVYEPQKAIILGAHLFVSPPEGSIIYNLEQITPESPLVNQTYLEILKNHKVWDYSKRNIRELNKLGVDAIHMPIGFHPVLDRLPILPWREQTDCLFYGSINKRRGLILNSINVNPIFNVYGLDLDSLISNAKIILNCHFYETKLFEIVRCSYLMANKKFILSEPGLDHELEEPFKEGIAFHKAEEWPEKVEFYLKNPQIMKKIAQKGYEIFSQMKQTEYLKNESKSW